jgi:mannose-6-phosphate isomerase-like protein (cupin superfamily)
MKTFLWIPFVLAALVAPAFGEPSTEHAAPHAIDAPETIEWKPFVGPFTWAILSGDPMKKGSPFVIRIKHPDGVKVPPHWHPIDEHMTTLTGKFRVGMGKIFEAGKTELIVPGGYMMVPKKTPHFAVGEGETIVQIHGIGPFTTTFVNPADDPRNQKPPAKQ